MNRPVFPIVIDEWPRSNRETIRVLLDSFQGRTIIHMRAFYAGPDGVMRPGRDGLALGLSHLPKLADALCGAYGEACARGLIVSDDDNARS